MVGIKLTRGNTSRETSWDTNDPQDVGNQVHQLTGLIDSLVSSGRFDSLLNAVEHVTIAAQGLSTLIEELRHIPSANLEGVLFRGRPWADSLTPPLEFGVPPNQRPGRFNGVGEVALYLSRSETVVRDELSQTFQTSTSTNYWVQRFEVRHAGLTLLKLDPTSCAPYPALNQFAIMFERPFDPQRTHPHIGMQLLRSICIDIGYDAIEYPTVTGSFSLQTSETNVAVLTEKAIRICTEAMVGAPYRLT